MYVYGGQLAEPFGSGRRQAEAIEAQTVWKLELKETGNLQWERIHCKKGAPGYRRDHSAITWNDCMIVYGGYWVYKSPEEEYGDVWSFDFVTCSWSQLQSFPPRRRMGVEPVAPEARGEHAARVAGDWMYISGGANISVLREKNGPPRPEFIAFNFSQMWRFSLSERRWEQVHRRGNIPTCRSEMAYTATNKGALLLAGGYSTSLSVVLQDGLSPTLSMASYFNDVFMYCPVNNYWRAVRGANLQGPLGQERAACCAVWLDGKLYVVGGYASQNDVQGIRETKVIMLICCAQCGAHKGESGKLYQCERCKAAGRAPMYYCSKDCLAQDWPLRKVVCSDKGILP